MEFAEIAKTFKIRASSASKIMGVKGLGETGKTYCEQWLKQALYHRQPEIKSKYIDKGNSEEEAAFTLMACELNLGMVYKNHSYFKDNDMCGTPDLIHDGIVYDNKCSWSLDTFPLFDKEISNKDYWWQLQVYMHLTGCDKAVLAYTLLDAPLHIVEQAVKWIAEPDKIYKVINELVYSKAYFDELKARFCPESTKDYFVEMPESLRIKTFEIAKDMESISSIVARVVQCRDYIAGL